MKYEYVLIAQACASIATAMIGRAKGSSLLIWAIIGFVLPVLGLIAAILYRSEAREPERACPQCGKIQKVYVQVCMRCGRELYLPDPSEIRRPTV